MKKILSALLFLLFSKSAVATDLGIHGVTYQIKEKSLLEEIQEKLQEAKKDGRLDKFQNGVKKQMLDQANNPKPVDGVVKATSNREWIYDHYCPTKNQTGCRLRQIQVVRFCNSF